MDMRCGNKKHAEIIEPGVIEVKCSSRFCGAGSGVVVIHRFDTLTGELIDTRQFSDPVRRKPDGADNHPAAVRNP